MRSRKRQHHFRDDGTANTGSILLGSGNGTFQGALKYGVDTYANSATVGDWNGDGKVDLAVANLNSGDVSILLNTSK